MGQRFSTGARRSNRTASTVAPGIHVLPQGRNRPDHILVDLRMLVSETLEHIIEQYARNGQLPPIPATMLLDAIVQNAEEGWIDAIRALIDVVCVPVDEPIGTSLLNAFLNTLPLPTTEQLSKLLRSLELTPILSQNPAEWHRNVCTVLGFFAQKLAGHKSTAALSSPATLDYLLANLKVENSSDVIIVALVALEKFAQTTENKLTITRRLDAMITNPLQKLEPWSTQPNDMTKRQVGFMAEWALDNLFLKAGRAFSCERINMDGVNVVLNQDDATEYLKIAPDGLEARNDTGAFESVRATFEVKRGVWFYEAQIVSQGVMQIGWTTKETKFRNHEGAGVGDDAFSVGYDGARRLVWFDGQGHPHTHDRWKPGDIVGCLLDLEKPEVMFYLNGLPLAQAHTQIFFKGRTGGFFPAASYSIRQHCRFNFGHSAFRFPPANRAFRNMNSTATLSVEKRLILPKHKRLAILAQASDHGSKNLCIICAEGEACVVLRPCGHDGFCVDCALKLKECAFCRKGIGQRLLQEASHASSEERDSVKF